jgi:hypothetical protein
MAAAAAAPPAPAAGAGERLAAPLQALGDALSLEAPAGLPPEVQELVGSWDVRTQALVRAATGGADGRPLQAAEATAAGELLQPLLNEAFVSAHPDLLDMVLDAVGAIARCCSDEVGIWQQCSPRAALRCVVNGLHPAPLIPRACNIPHDHAQPLQAFPLYFGPGGASFLHLFASEQLSQEFRGRAAKALVRTLGQPGCAAAVLAAPGGEGLVGALIAAAKCEGDLLQGRAFVLLAELARAHNGVRERVASADAALLPLAVERVRAAAAGATSQDPVVALQGPLLLLCNLVASKEPISLRARALATPGLAAAAADLLMALSSEAWAAARQEWSAANEEWAPSWEELEAAILMVLGSLMSAGGGVRASAFYALTTRGALPRVFVLLRSPRQAARVAASRCIAAFTETDAGRDALFLVPRAASELAAALRRAHADGEDPSLTQCRAARVLWRLLCHSQGSRVADGLARAAMAEGSAGPLLGALAGLLAASVDGDVPLEVEFGMFECSTAVLSHMLTAAMAQQLRLLHVLQRSPVAEACVRALRDWPTEPSDAQFNSALLLIPLVADLSGFTAALSSAPAGGIPAATAATTDTAAVRAALREAPGMEGALRRFLAWARSQPQDEAIKAAVTAGDWLLTLPEVKAQTAAAVGQAPAAAAPTARAAAPAAAAKGPTAGPASAASAAPTTVPPAAAAQPPPAAPSRSAVQQPRDRANTGASALSSDNSSSTSGDSGCSREAAASPRACGGCGKSESEVPLLRCVGCKAQYYCGDACARAHWRSHRAACKAAARRAAAALPS